MTDLVEELVELLDLEQLEVNLFRGHTVDPTRFRLYGGEVLAQALMAAGRTLEPNRHVHSLHAYFLKLGDPKVPVIYDVDRIRDGGSFTTRRVVAIQHGQAIFNLAASFHVEEAGPDHQDPMPDVEGPEGATQLGDDDHEGHEQINSNSAPHVVRAFDVRHVGSGWAQPGFYRGEPLEPDHDTWFKTHGALPDDPLLHACVIAYASDSTLLRTAMLPHPIAEDHAGFMVASLDHVMWFHRPCRADEWLLYHVHSPSAAGARGFAIGQVFGGGTLAVTVAQEGLVRPLLDSQ
jgi:acyl-CoA thioesterase-2